ncbi:MAG: hypothetical protein ABH836_01925 [Candidatus Omnitrophota bacterium]
MRAMIQQEKALGKRDFMERLQKMFGTSFQTRGRVGQQSQINRRNPWHGIKFRLFTLKSFLKNISVMKNELRFVIMNHCATKRY